MASDAYQNPYTKNESQPFKGEAPVGIHATEKQKDYAEHDGVIRAFDASGEVKIRHTLQVGTGASDYQAVLNKIASLDDSQLNELAGSTQLIDYVDKLGPRAADIFSPAFFDAGREAERAGILNGIRQGMKNNNEKLHISNQFPAEYVNLPRNWLVMQTKRTVGGQENTRTRNSTAHMGMDSQAGALKNIEAFVARIDEVNASKPKPNPNETFPWPVTMYKGCITSFTDTGVVGFLGGEGVKNKNMKNAIAEYNRGKPTNEQMIFVESEAYRSQSTGQTGKFGDPGKNPTLDNELAFQNERYQTIRKEIVEQKKPELSDVDFEKDMRRLYANEQDFTVDAMKKKWGLSRKMTDESVVAMASYATKRTLYEQTRSDSFDMKTENNNHITALAVGTDLINEIYGESSSEGCKSNKDRGAMVMMESLAVDECAAESANWQLTDPIKAEKAMQALYEKDPGFFCENQTLDSLHQQREEKTREIDQYGQLQGVLQGAITDITNPKSKSPFAVGGTSKMREEWVETHQTVLPEKTKTDLLNVDGDGGDQVRLTDTLNSAYTDCIVLKQRLKNEVANLDERIAVKNYLMLGEHFKHINEQNYHTTVSDMNAPGAAGAQGQGERDPEIGKVESDKQRQMLPSIQTLQYNITDRGFLARKNVEFAIAKMNKSAKEKYVEKVEEFHSAAKQKREDFIPKISDTESQFIAENVYGSVSKDNQIKLFQLLDKTGDISEQSGDFDEKANALFAEMGDDDRRAVMALASHDNQKLSGDESDDGYTTSETLSTKSDVTLEGSQLDDIPLDDAPKEPNIETFTSALRTLKNNHVSEVAKFADMQSLNVTPANLTDAQKDYLTKIAAKRVIDQQGERTLSEMNNITGGWLQKIESSKRLQALLEYRALCQQESSYEQGVTEIKSAYNRCLERDAAAKYGITNLDANDPLQKKVFQDLQGDAKPIFDALAGGDNQNTLETAVRETIAPKRSETEFTSAVESGSLPKFKKKDIKNITEQITPTQKADQDLTSTDNQSSSAEENSPINVKSEATEKNNATPREQLADKFKQLNDRFAVRTWNRGGDRKIDKEKRFVTALNRAQRFGVDDNALTAIINNPEITTREKLINALDKSAIEKIRSERQNIRQTQVYDSETQESVNVPVENMQVSSGITLESEGAKALFNQQSNRDQQKILSGIDFQSELTPEDIHRQINQAVTKVLASKATTAGRYSRSGLSNQDREQALVNAVAETRDAGVSEEVISELLQGKSSRSDRAEQFKAICAAKKAGVPENEIQQAVNQQTRKDLVTHLKAKVSERQESPENPGSDRLTQLEKLRKGASAQADNAAHIGTKLGQSIDDETPSQKPDSPSPTDK